MPMHCSRKMHRIVHDHSAHWKSGISGMPVASDMKIQVMQDHIITEVMKFRYLDMGDVKFQ